MTWPIAAHRRAAALLAICCGLLSLIAGCGTSIRPSAAATTSPTKRAAGIAAESPEQILKQSAAAMRRAGNFRMRGTLTTVSTPSRTMQFSFDLFGAGRVSIALSVNGESADMILDAGSAYMRGSQSFWNTETHGSGMSALFANRWLLFPTASIASLTSAANEFSVSRLTTCMIENHGRLAVVGNTTVDHRPAIVLRGTGAGGVRDTMAISSTGSPYPLRVTATGQQQRRRVTRGPCGSNSGQSYDGTLILSGFGRLGKLQLPRHAINIRSLEPGQIPPAALNS